MSQQSSFSFHCSATGVQNEMLKVKAVIVFQLDLFLLLAVSPLQSLSRKSMALASRGIIRSQEGGPAAFLSIFACGKK